MGVDGVDWEALPLSRWAVSRAAHRRVEPGVVAGSLAAAGTRVVLVRGAEVACSDADRDLMLLPAAELVALGAAGQPGLLWFFLGEDEHGAVLGLVVPRATSDEVGIEGFAEPAGPPQLWELARQSRWAALRDVGGQLCDRDAGLATTAVALAAWHERNPRCPRCGELTEVEAAGWVRRCPTDGSEHYPRTDPAVIMAVVDHADRLLLGHASHWPQGRFSTLAGYVEPGEGLESAVRREVLEETAVVIGDVEYRGSQPWPFPASLMFGFRAQALTTDIEVDGHEVTGARWFTREQLQQEVLAGTIALPMGSSIALALIEDWYGGPILSPPAP